MHIRKSDRASYPTFVRVLSKRLGETTDDVKSVLVANGFRADSWADPDIYWQERRMEVKRSR
jgi:hypothetical protein